MKFCYVCSPYRGNIFKRIRNIRYAREMTMKAIKAGYIPITPHLYLTQVLNDKKAKERMIGLKLGIELLDICEVICVGDRYGISRGMENEIERAKEAGIKIWRA